MKKDCLQTGEKSKKEPKELSERAYITGRRTMVERELDVRSHSGEDKTHWGRRSRRNRRKGRETAVELLV